MPDTMETQFENVYGVRQKKDEDRQDYLSRLVTKVNDTTDANWNRLTDDAQEWFNRAIKPWAAEKAIPDFPDDDVTDDEPPSEESTDEEDEREDADSGAGEEEEVMSTKARSKKTAAKKGASSKNRSSSSGSSKKAVVAKKKKTAATSANGSSALALSGSSVVKRAMLRNMRATTQELQDALKKKGMKLSPVRISIIRSEFKHSIRLLQEDEKLKDHYAI